jgi:hypothetical protein
VCRGVRQQIPGRGVIGDPPHVAPRVGEVGLLDATLRVQGVGQLEGRAVGLCLQSDAPLLS